MTLPASLDQITVTGKFLQGDGNPETGTVTFTSVQLLQSGAENTFITPVKKTVNLVEDGSFSVDLPATDDPDWVPQGYAYQLNVVLSNNFARMWTLSIPWTAPGGTIDLADVLPNSDVNAPASFVLLNMVGVPGGPAGPLDSEGLIPEEQLPAGGGGGGAVDSVNGYDGVVVLTKDDLDLADVDNTSDAAKPVSTAAQNALDGKADLVAGKVPVAQIPSVALVAYLGAVDNEAEMLALSGEQGDWTTRADLGTTWVITGLNPASLGDWTQYTYPASPVASVNGQTGTVVLGFTDVGAQEAGSYAPLVHTHTVKETISFGDERTTLTTGAGASRWYNRTGVTLAIAGVWVAADTVPVGSDLVVDVHKNGITVFTTQANRPKVADGTSGGVLAVPDVTTLADGDYLTFDIDAVGSGTPGGSLSGGVVVSHAW